MNGNNGFLHHHHNKKTKRVEKICTPLRRYTTLYYTFDCSVVELMFIFNLMGGKNEVMKNVKMKMKMHASEDKNEEDGLVCLFV